MTRHKWEPSSKELGQMKRFAETAGKPVFGLRATRKKHPVSWRGIQ